MAMLPVERSKAQARGYYDRLSGIYDWLTASEQRLIRKGVAVLAPKPEETVLEIGCGTGTGLAAIATARQGSGGLYGLDLSYKMLQKTRRNLAALALTPLLMEGEAERLPFPPHTVDAVYCAFTLELFSQPEMATVLNEIQRLLKPGGRLVIVSLSREPRNGMVRLYELGHRLFPVALDCRPIPVQRILEDSGLHITAMEKVMNWGLPVDIVLAVG